MLRVCVLASGRGSNFQALLDAIGRGEVAAEVVLAISNKSAAGALEIARCAGIEAVHLSEVHFAAAEEYVAHLLSLLEKQRVDLVVLAGYLKKIPDAVVRRFQGRIINIHPALLPSFGGQGLYGHHVHEAVLKYGCRVSGATVHLVEAEYDSGAPILQSCVAVEEGDTAETLAARVLAVEHRLLPAAVELYARGRIRIEGRRVRIVPEEER